MRTKNQGLTLQPRELAAAFDTADWGTRFPPVLSVNQAAELLQIPKSTIYDWSSRGLLKGCSRRVGKRLLFWRDRLIDKVFNKGINDSEQD